MIREEIIQKRDHLQEADLQGADLQRANLREANLQRADLQRANLQRANLREADLRGADLWGANLWGADLWGADLREADLQEADLWGANLQRANLQEADLRGADLRGANLQEADLWGADLQKIKYDYLTIGIHPPICGDLIIYKKVHCTSLDHDVVITLFVDKETPRTCATTRKYRCWGGIPGKDTPEGCYSDPYDGKRTDYIAGIPVMPDSFDMDRWIECGHGIHGFLTREEAEAWEL